MLTQLWQIALTMTGTTVTALVPTTIDRDWSRLYNEFPERYDEFAEAQDADEGALTFVRQQVDLRGKTILDIGAGSGRYTRRVAREAAIVHCIEPCGPLLEVAKKRAAEVGLVSVRFHQASAQEVPLPASSVDVVLAMHSINAIGARDVTRPDQRDGAEQRFEQRALAVDELLRVLRPGGWLFSLGPAPDGYGGGLSDLVLGEWHEEWNRGKSRYLDWMANRYGFATTPIRGDWVFPDPGTAAAVYGFVYGADAGRHIREHDLCRIENRLVMQSLRKAAS